jgi:hypothetical protein
MMSGCVFDYAVTSRMQDARCRNQAVGISHYIVIPATIASE